MATTTEPVVNKHKREVIEKAVLRFCGDSGDGMQITGNQFFGLTSSQIASGSATQSSNVFLTIEPALITTHPWSS